MPIHCPTCRRETFWEGNPFRPFCSERCKLVDLDNWLSERYGIPVRTETEGKGSPAPIPNAEEAGD